VYGLAVSRSGYGCECMGLLYLVQDKGMLISAPLCRSKYDCECMSWLYLGQDMSLSVWAGCI
jgi:hypothetical protein